METTPELLAVAAAILQREEFGSDAEASARNPNYGNINISAGHGAEHSGDCTKKPWTCQRCLADDYIGLARAALSAIREPTEAMSFAGFSKNRFRNFNECCDSPTRTAAVTIPAEPAWRAIIDHILGEPTSPKAP